MITEKPWEHDESCATCIFYFARSCGDQGWGPLPTGQCRRYPPSAEHRVWVRRPWLASLIYSAAFDIFGGSPKMNDCDWCGEYVRGLNNLSNAKNHGRDSAQGGQHV